MDNLERYFTHLCKEKAEKNNGVLKIHKVQKMCALVSVCTLLNLQDHAFAENPLEREYDEVEMKPEDVKSLQELYQLMRESGFEGLESKRIPVPEDRAPPEFCFDMMTGINKFFHDLVLITWIFISDILKSVPASVPCIFSDQQGRGRTSLGMVIACLIKEMQITTELRSDQHSRLHSLCQLLTTLGKFSA